MLAAAIGSIFVLVALSIMLMIQRSDRKLGDRYEQMNDLYAVRLVLDRTFNRLLMSEQPVPAPPQGSGITPHDWVRQLRETDPDSLGPERILLDNDPRLSGFAVQRRNDSAAGLIASPQRLEVVLTDSPVPSRRAEVVARAVESDVARSVDARRRASDAARGVREGTNRDSIGGGGGASRTNTPGGASRTNTPGGADRTNTPGGADRPDNRAAPSNDGPARGAGPAQEPGAIPGAPSPLDITLRSVRGVFELRPQPGATLDGAGRPRSWELWWMPLPRVGSTWDEVEPAPELDPPFRIASHIRYLHWRIYRDRAWLNSVRATVPPELPAYIEAEIETTAGLSDRWLFEVTYAFGPELPRRTDAAPGAGGADDRRSGASPRVTGGGAAKP